MTVFLLSLYLVPILIINFLYLFFKWKRTGVAHYIIFLQFSLFPVINIAVAYVLIRVLIDEIKNKFKDE